MCLFYTKLKYFNLELTVENSMIRGWLLPIFAEIFNFSGGDKSKHEARVIEHFYPLTLNVCTGTHCKKNGGKVSGK